METSELPIASKNADDEGEKKSKFDSTGEGKESEPKKNVEKAKSIDEMMKYLNDISNEHQSLSDRKRIQQVFTSFQEKGRGLGSIAGLNQKKAQLAYEKIFEEWKVDLTGQQEQRLEEDHFEPLFEQYAGKGDFTTIRASDAVPFMRELMDISYEDKL